MADVVTVFGGAGFLGRYAVRRLAKMGLRVRVATRRPEQAGFVRMYGHVGQVVPVPANVRDDDSVREAVRGADAVVNCVGTFESTGRNGFDAIHGAASDRVARLALEMGAGRLVHVSAIGADPKGGSAYARSKAAGEAAALARMPLAVVLRPSILFGTEDKFFNRFATIAARSPVVPVVGADARFQPAWVDDVAHAVALAAGGRAAPGTYELGGPEVLTFRELMERMLLVTRRRRLVLNVPFPIARLMGTVGGWGEALSGGLARAPITRDQVEALRSDNVVAPTARGFEALGIVPTAMDAVLPDYLWRFRPSGQYDAIKESARNLRA